MIYNVAITKKDLIGYLNCIENFKKIDKKIKTAHRSKIEKFLEEFIKNDFKDIIKNFDKKTYELYYKLVWEEEYLNYEDYDELFNEPLYTKRVYWEEYLLKGKYCFITRAYEKGWRSYDIIYIKPQIRKLLKEVFEKPKFYYLEDKNVTAMYEYINEYVLDNFKEVKYLIDNGMFKDVDKKPLQKELKLLNVPEFYPQHKKLKFLASEFLARSVKIYFYYNKSNEDIDESSLKRHILKLLKASYYNTVNDMLRSHLKNTYYLYDLDRLFVNSIYVLLNELPDEFISMENVFEFLKYRDLLYINIPKEVQLKANPNITAENYKKEIVIYPAIKGLLFYYAALGVVEIKYDEPKNPYEFLDTDVISPFDGLKGVKITDFGKYVIGKKTSFKFKKLQKPQEEIIFDEFKPVIKLKNPEPITVSKIERFAKKLKDSNYILDYKTFFSDCENYQDVKEKINEFKKFFKNTPNVFSEFIEKVEKNLSSLEKEEFIVFKIKNDEMINLFLEDDKLKNLIIRAEGRRILVDEKDKRKFLNALKEKGFFIPTENE